MKNKNPLSFAAFIISIVGFLTGWILIGIIFDVVAIILALITLIAKKDEKKLLSYFALGIASLGIIFTIMFYTSAITSPSPKSTASENAISTNTVLSQNIVSENTVSEDTVSENKATDTISKNEVSKNEVTKTVSENVVSEKIVTEKKVVPEKEVVPETVSTYTFQNIKYPIVSVDGGNLSGSRQSNVAVDIGFGDRVYWGITNKYGQLVYVVADKIILQNDTTEPVNSDGRYYDDEAAVPGTEDSDLDQGHVIADSLGGVSNAYNITPQNSTLNRYGDQAYMEKVIRDAGGCEKFIATITYPNTKTQIPSSYKYEYILKGEKITDEFPNENPEKETTTTTDTSSDTTTNTSSGTTSTVASGDISSIDTNGNGIVTIKEAEAAGYSMPIHSDHWLYPYMIDRDSDGMVGE